MRSFTMLDPEVIERIRRIFLQDRPHVSIRTAAWLLGWSWEEMTAAIRAGEVELVSTPLGKWFPRNELMAKGLEAWPLDVIEEALGDDAARVRRRRSGPRTARPAAAVPDRHAALLRPAGGDDRQRRPLPGARRHGQRELGGAVDGTAQVR